MDARRRPGLPPTGGVGGGRAWRPSLGWLALALVSLAGGVAFSLTSSPPPAAAVAAVTPAATAPVAGGGSAVETPMSAAVASTGPAPSNRVPAAPATRSPAPATPSVAPRAWEPGTDPTPDLSSYVNPGETPTMAEVIDRLHQAGVYGGLGAFPPPGTRPPLVGLAVPDDYVLPEGYVRHHQATDDGQPIEPILMFSPDRQFVDVGGTPVAIPKDRVVPPELAPPGLSVRTIVIPPPIDPGRPGR